MLDFRCWWLPSSGSSLPTATPTSIPACGENLFLIWNQSLTDIHVSYHSNIKFYPEGSPTRATWPVCLWAGEKAAQTKGDPVHLPCQEVPSQVSSLEKQTRHWSPFPGRRGSTLLPESSSPSSSPPSTSATGPSTYRRSTSHWDRQQSDLRQRRSLDWKKRGNEVISLQRNKVTNKVILAKRKQSSELSLKPKAELTNWESNLGQEKNLKKAHFKFTSCDSCWIVRHASMVHTISPNPSIAYKLFAIWRLEAKQISTPTPFFVPIFAKSAHVQVQKKWHFWF